MGRQVYVMGATVDVMVSAAANQKSDDLRADLQVHDNSSKPY